MYKMKRKRVSIYFDSKQSLSHVMKLPKNSSQKIMQKL